MLPNDGSLKLNLKIKQFIFLAVRVHIADSDFSGVQT